MPAVFDDPNVAARNMVRSFRRATPHDPRRGERHQGRGARRKRGSPPADAWGGTPRHPAFGYERRRSDGSGGLRRRPTAAVATMSRSVSARRSRLVPLIAASSSVGRMAVHVSKSSVRDPPVGQRRGHRRPGLPRRGGRQSAGIRANPRPAWVLRRARGARRDAGPWTADPGSAPRTQPEPERRHRVRILEPVIAETSCQPRRPSRTSRNRDGDSGAMLMITRETTFRRDAEVRRDPSANGDQLLMSAG